MIPIVAKDRLPASAGALLQRPLTEETRWGQDFTQGAVQKPALRKLQTPSGHGFCCIHTVFSMQLTGDSYDSAIRQAVRIMGDAGEKAHLGETLRESMRTWHEQASYSEVRNLISSVRGIKGQVRISG